MASSKIRKSNRINKAPYYNKGKIKPKLMRTHKLKLKVKKVSIQLY